MYSGFPIIFLSGVNRIIKDYFDIHTLMSGYRSINPANYHDILKALKSGWRIRIRLAWSNPEPGFKIGFYPNPVVKIYPDPVFKIWSGPASV